MFSKIAVLIVLTLGSATIHAGKPMQPSLPEVGALVIGEDFDTPTCIVDTADGQSIFAAQYDLEPIMKLDGKLVKMRLADGERSLWDYSKQDEKISTRYVYEDMTLELQGNVSHSCEVSDNENCEYTEMTFEAIFTNGSQSLKFEKLIGGCGV